MADKKISEATADDSVTGVEKVPVDDGGSAKFATTAQIKDYVLAQIAALTAASGVSVSDDSVYILKSGALKPVSAATLAAAIMNEAFGRAAVVGPNGNEVIAIKDSDTRKTITFTALKTWLQSNMTVTPDLTLSTAGAAGTLGDSDLALVVQAASGKKVTLATLKDYVLGKLAAYMAATTAAQSVSGTDIVLIAQGGVLRKATVSQLLGNASGGVTGPNTTTENKIPQWDSTTKKLKDGLTLTNEVNGNSTASQVPSAAAVHAAITGMGDVKAPATTTENKIPQWDSTAKKLKDGLTVTSSVSSSSTATQIPTAAAVHSAIDAKGDVKKSGTPAAGSLAKWDANGKVEGGPSVVNSTAGIADAENASDEKVPTEKAVRDAVEDAAGVGAPETPVQGNIPTWGEGSALTGGMAVVTEIGTYPNVSDEKIPTEKAVRDVLENTVMKPSSHVENCIPTWGSGTELKAGLAVVPSTTGIASADNASDEKIPTEKAVRAILPVAATTTTAGLMSASDKAKLNNIVDTTAVEEVGDTGLADADVVTVLKGGSTWKRSLLSRFWTYIMGKLATFKIDDLAAGEDNSDLDATTERHGLCPKFPNDNTKFLRGDGTFAVPAGSSAFTGDSGSGGTSGLVPAPASGDAGDNKFLSANGTWATPPSAAGVDIPGATAIDALADADVFYVYDSSANGYRKVTAAEVRGKWRDSWHGEIHGHDARHARVPVHRRQGSGVLNRVPGRLGQEFRQGEAAVDILRLHGWRGRPACEVRCRRGVVCGRRGHQRSANNYG